MNEKDKEIMFSYLLQYKDENEKRVLRYIDEFEPYIDKLKERKGHIPMNVTAIASDMMTAVQKNVQPNEWYEKAVEIEEKIENPPKDTDYEKVRKMYNELGVNITIENPRPMWGFTIVIGTERNTKVRGWGIVEYYFDSSGMFLEMGIWE